MARQAGNVPVDEKDVDGLLPGGDVVMSLSHETSLGKVHIDADVVAVIAGAAAVEGYGLVGMSAPGLKQGIALIRRREELAKGVVVSGDDDGVVIDLHVIAQYGVNIVEVCHNVMEQVKYAVEGHCGLQVARVNVHVEGVRVDGPAQTPVRDRRGRRSSARR